MENKSIPFIYFQNNKFHLNPQAEEYLQTLNKKQLGIVSVAGLYRTGKSFFINRVLLNQQQGFQVGPTVQPCTKGLWLWKDTLSQNNENMDILIIDTEGFGGIDENQNHDSRIFLFSLLLSSYFIYNSRGTIDESALNTISLITNLAKDICQKNGDQMDNFPCFHWIVRDFVLQMVDKQGMHLKEKAYLENALLEKDSLNPQIEQKNRIRKLLKTFFVDRDCNTMVIPTEKEQDLQNLSQIPNSELRPEFTDQMNKIRKKIFSKVQPKLVKNKPINGQILIQLCKAYIECINDGNLPHIESSWSYVCKSQNQKIIEQQITELDNQLKNQKEVIDNKDINSFKQKLFNQIMDNFKKHTLDNKTESQQELKDRFEKIFENFKEINSKGQKQKLFQLIDSDLKTIYNYLEQGHYLDPFQLNTDINKIYIKNKQYFQQNELWFLEISEPIYKKGIEILYSQEKFKIQAQLKKFELDKDQTLKDQQLFKQNHLQMIENYKIQIDQLKQEIQKEKLQNQQQQQITIQLEDKFKREYEQKEHEFQAKQSKYLQLTEELKRNQDTMKNQLSQQKSVFEKDIALLEQEKQFKNKELESYIDKIDQLTQDQKDNRIENSQKQENIYQIKEQSYQLELQYKQEIQLLQNEFTQKIELMKQENNKQKQIQQQNSDLQVENTVLKDQYQFVKSQHDQLKSQHDTYVQQTLTQNFNKEKDQDQDKQDMRQTNKNLSSIIEKQVERISFLEEKLEKSKYYKKLFQQSAALQCKNCSKHINSQLFEKHVDDCKSIQSNFQTPQQQPRDTNNKNIINYNIDQQYLQISINQTMIREQPDNKPFTEYQIQIKYMNKQ